MIQLTVISDGTREGTHVLLPDGSQVGGVIGVDYSLTADGSPFTSIHLVGVRTKISVEPEFLDDVETATLEELLNKHRLISMEIKRRQTESPQDGQDTAYKNSPTAAAESLKEEASLAPDVVSGTRPIPEERVVNMLLPES